MTQEATLTVRYTVEKETKNTVRFQELSEAQGEPTVLGTIYIQKWAWTRLGHPQAIQVTVAAAESAD